MKNLKLVFLFSIFLMGCSMDASITNLMESLPPSLFTKASNKEIVPSSQQGTATSAGYRVQSSVSYYNGKSQVVTDKGYKVRTSVQATLYRE